MQPLENLRLNKIRHYVNRLIPPYLIRQTTAAENLQLLEPADMRFDCPPDAGPWQNIQPGCPWGGKQQYAYFRGTFTIPAHWKDNPIDLRIIHNINFLAPIHDDNTPVGPEGQAFINGQRIGAIDRRHNSARYPFQPGQTYDVRAVIFAGRPPCRHTLQTYGLALVDAATEKLYHDMRLALEMVQNLPAESLDRAACWMPSTPP